MKPCLFLIIIMLANILNGFGQAAYTTSLNITFTGGNNGSFFGNLSADVACSVNSVDGVLNVGVNKVNSQLSVLSYYSGSCWSNRLKLDQNNRYMEFRIRSNVAITRPMKVYYKWSGCDGCCSEPKTIPTDSFTLPEADTWKTVFLKIPSSTGGSQNIIDTMLDRSIAWGLENGYYTIDYFKIGDAAVPPKPAINTIKPKSFVENSGIHTINLSGISIPGRFIDGLTIKAEPLSDGILSDVSILDLGSGPFAVDEATNIATAALQFSFVPGMGSLGDSIIITLEDTIRKTITKTSFYVTAIPCVCDNEPWLAHSDGKADGCFKVYPSPTTGIANLNMPSLFSGDIEVINITGNIVFSQKLESTVSTAIDLTDSAPGIYFIKICNGSDVIIKKVVKK